MPYTRKGDNGMSGLFGTNERFKKDSDCYESLGTLDELNCLLGLCRNYAKQQHMKEIDMPKEIKNIQEHLFIIQAELAGSDKSLQENSVLNAEHLIDSIEKLMIPQRTFIIPGETKLSAWFDYARTVSRRAERNVIRLHRIRPTSIIVRAYLNRLSSLLYAFARFACAYEKVHEDAPSYQ